MSRVCAWLCVLVAASAVSCSAFDRHAALAKMPEQMVLNAPFTAFYANGSVNVEVIPKMAAFAASRGVTVAWSCGGMAQFFTLTVSERKAINAAWVKAGHEHGLYIIVHVGTTVPAEAAELAAHANEIGADAIASVPPYYSTPSDFESLFSFFEPIAAEAPELPFFMYHIPGATGYQVKMAELFAAAEKAMPQLIGVKYVSPDMEDWMNLVNTYNETHAMMFAPEPKLQSFGVGLGRGTVLAEDFYAGTYLRMRNYFLRGDAAAARKEQAWKYSAMAIFSKFGGGAAERAIYKRLCGVELGELRAPAKQFDATKYDELLAELDTIDFFNKTAP